MRISRTEICGSRLHTTMSISLRTETSTQQGSSQGISNSYGEIKIDKALDEDRIDPIDAIIDAWKAAMKEEYKPDTNEVVNEWLEMYEKYMGKGGEKE